MADAAFDIRSALQNVPDSPEAGMTPTTGQGTQPMEQPAPTETPKASGAPKEAAGGFDIRAALKGVEDVDTSPITPPEPKPGITDPNLLFIPPTPVPDVITDAARRGVDFENPAPTGHFLSSLAIDGEHARKAYAASLSQHFGQDIKVRVNPRGDIEYLHPETRRYTLASPPGAVQAKIEALGGPSIAFGPELFAGTAAAIVTRNPNITIGAGAVGAFLGEMARLELGRQMGTNEGVKDSAIINEAAKAAGISLIAGKAGDMSIKAAAALLQMVRGKRITAEMAEELGVSAQEAEEIAEKVNSRITDTKLKFSLAQASNDEELLAAQEYFRKTPGYRAAFRDFDEQSEAAVREFYEKINTPYRTRTDSSDNLRAVQEKFALNIDQRATREALPAEMKRAELDAAVRSIKDKPYENVGAPIRAQTNKERQAFQEWANEARDSMDALAGGKRIIRNNETFKVVRDLDRKASTALFAFIRKSQRNLVGTPNNNIQGDVFNPHSKFTFAETWETISALKEMERRVGKGMTTDAPDVGSIKRLYNALEADLRESLQGSPLRAQYDTFIQKYAQQKARLDRGVVGDIMTREGGKNGRFVVADEQVFRRFFTPGTDREATELFSVVKDSPEQMQGIREAIGDFYKREVLVDGRVNLTAHKKWIERYSKAASVFFGKNDMKLLNRPGGIEAALRAREAARDKALKHINNTLDARLANLESPNRLLNRLMDKPDPAIVGEVVDALEDTPAVLRGLQSAFRVRMSERIAGTLTEQGRKISLPRLTDFLHGKSGESGFLPVVERLYGRQYADDLVTLESAMKIAARENVAPNRSNTAFTTSALKYVVRFLVPPLSMASRRANVGVGVTTMLRQKASERLLFNAMMNPENMRALMEVKDTPVSSRKVAAVFSQLGASALLEDFGEVE